jgi:NAD(P)H-dependent flavin oxidoreductase YrpB (nitropropane dioxygenase family)
MWPRTDLHDLLGITHPIIQAPMSGFGGPALVAAVSNAGALGSLSCAALPVQTARKSNRRDTSSQQPAIQPKLFRSSCSKR